MHGEEDRAGAGRFTGFYELGKVIERAQVNPAEAHSGMIERQHHTPEFLPGIVQGDQDGRAGMKNRCGIHSYDCGTVAPGLKPEASATRQ